MAAFSRQDRLFMVDRSQQQWIVRKYHQVQPGIDAGNTNGRAIRRGNVIVRRRNWLYRMAGQKFVQSISFEHPITAAQVRNFLRASVGVPLEIWGRSSADLLQFH